MRAARPAMDRVVMGKIIFRLHHRLAELGEPDLCLAIPLVARVLTWIERSLTQSENERLWTLRQLIEQVARLAFVDDTSIPHRVKRLARIGAAIAESFQHE